MLGTLLAPARPTSAWEGFRIDRVAGANRYETAAAIALDSFPGGATAAVVASGADFPDALTGAQLGVPILLTQPDSVPLVTQRALDQLGVETIYLLGGAAAIGDDVVGQLDDHELVRLAGADRYETAAAVARRAGADVRLLLTSGESFADALGAGAVAGTAGIPLLLTRRDALPSSTAAAIEELDPLEIVLVGGPAAVSDAIVTALEGDGRTVTRLAGPHREATAVALADYAIQELGLVPDYVLLASSRDFPDALAAAGAARAWGAPLLLASGDQISRELQAHVQDTYSLDVLLGRAFGGTAALSEAVVLDLERWAGDTFAHYWVTGDVSPAITTGTTPEVVRLPDGSERLFLSGELDRAWDTADGTAFVEVDAALPAGTDPAIVPTPSGWRMYFLRDGAVLSATSTDALVWALEPGLRFETTPIADLEAVALVDGSTKLLFSDGDGTRGASSSDGLTFSAETWYLPDLTAPGVVQLANGFFMGAFERVVDGERQVVQADSYDGRTWEENGTLLYEYASETDGEHRNPTLLPYEPARRYSSAQAWLYFAQSDGAGGFTIHRTYMSPGDG